MIEAHQRAVNQQTRNDLSNTVDTTVNQVLLELREHLLEEPLENWFPKLEKLVDYYHIKSIVADYIENHTSISDMEHPDNVKRYIHDITSSLQRIALQRAEVLRLDQLKIEQVRSLEGIFLNQTDSDDWKTEVHRIISQTEALVDNILRNPFPINKIGFHSEVVFNEETKELVHQWAPGPQEFSGTLISYKDIDRTLQEYSNKIEEVLYERAQSFLQEHVVQRNRINLVHNVTNVSEDADHTLGLSPFAPNRTFPKLRETLGGGTWYEENVENKVKDFLKSKYSRKELGFFNDQKLSEPEEEPYEFTSPEGEFLEKNKAVYEKLRNANPSHEQGILAREVGLSAVEVADEEFANGNEPEAETAFQIAEAMSDIALGVMPYIGTGKDIYELVTGKHLLTGRDLTIFERSMSGVGIALAGVSSGFLNSGQLKAALNTTNAVFSKVNRKLLARTLQGLSDVQLFRTMKEYPEVVFRSLDSIGLRTKADVQSALKFLRRAFVREDPPIVQVAQAIKVAGKEGIEAYTRVVDELETLPQAGEEFLAKKLRHSGIGQNVDVPRLGKFYNQIFKNLNDVELKTLNEIESIQRFVRPNGTIQVWRGMRKKHILDRKNIYRWNEYMGRFNKRYSIKGDRVFYTSLTDKTALKEVGSAHGLTKLEDIRKAFTVEPRVIEDLDNVLDLTDANVLRQLSKGLDEVLIEKRLIKLVPDNPDAYELPQIIGHTAKNNKKVKAVLTPAAQNTSAGKNLILFEELP